MIKSFVSTIDFHAFIRSQNPFTILHITSADLLPRSNSFGGKLGHGDCLSGLGFLDGDRNELAPAAAAAVAGGVNVLDAKRKRDNQCA